MRSTSDADAHGKGNVRAGHGCIGGSDLWDTPQRTGMERKDSLEIDSLREQSLELYRDEVRSTQGGDVHGSDLCRKI